MGPQPGMAGTLKPPTALCSVPLFWVHGCAQEGTDVMFGMPSLPTSLWVSEQTQPGLACLGAVVCCLRESRVLLTRHLEKVTSALLTGL